MAYDDPHFLRTDITRLDYFAAHAPVEIPSFFHPEPDPYDGPPAPAIPADASDEDRRLLESWINDACFDLPEEYKWFQEASETYHTAVSKHREFAQAERYLLWRWQYAEMMLNMRDMFVDPDDDPGPGAPDSGSPSLARRPSTLARRRS